MKLVEDVIPITTVTTREEIAAWTEERRAILTELVELADLRGGRHEFCSHQSRRWGSG
jgi:hypothetical protein